MDTQLYRAAEHLAAHGPAASAWRAQLYEWAVGRPSDQRLTRGLTRGLVLVAALLLGSGLIFWIAANWSEWSRGARLGLIQFALLAAVAAACLWPAVRNAALLGAILALGGLLAFIGQTYQTGADTWQLFATWAALSLLWVLAARSDLMWTVWVVIAALALALWTGPLGLWDQLFSAGRQTAAMQSLSMLAWFVLGLVPLVVASIAPLRPAGGWGRWSHRVAWGMALAVWAGSCVAELFVGRGWLGLWSVAALLIALVFWLSLRTRWRDLPTLSLTVAAANVLVVALAARLLFSRYEDVGALLVLGLLGLACLGASATWLLRQQQSSKWGELREEQRGGQS